MTRLPPLAHSAALTLALTGSLALAGVAQPPPLPPGVPGAEAHPFPVNGRESTVRVTVGAPDPAGALLVAQRPPAGATYRPGSSRLNGAPLPDPHVGPNGTLYWTLPGGGLLSYGLTHGEALPALEPPALAALDPRGGGRLLAGALDPADRAAARPPVTSSAPRENPGRLRLPLDGGVYRDRDQVTVVLEGPADEVIEVRVNGELLPRTLIGRRSPGAGSGTQRLEFVGVRLRPGENVLTAGTDRVRLTLAGRTREVVVVPEQIVADGVTPVRLRLRAVDERGVSTALPFLTVRSTPEPGGPDANPREAGYQVRLTAGEGVLVLPPQAAPGRVTVESDLGDGQPRRAAVDLQPGRARVGVGLVSVTLAAPGGAGQPFGVSATARASLETPLGRGRLVLAADSDGLPVGRDPQVGYAAHGDRSAEGTPLQGQDPLAFRYDHPEFGLSYRQSPAPVTTVTVPGAPTALSVETRMPVVLSAFAALVPREAREDRLTPDGTRLLRLGRGNVAPDSETVEVLASDPRTGTVEARRLTRGADYVLDPVLGLLTLAAPLDRVDGAWRDVTVRVTYRLAEGGERVPAGGAEVRARVGDLRASAAVVALPEGVTTAARLSYETRPLGVSALAAHSGGLLLDAAGRATLGGASATFGVHHQTPDYAGLNAGGVGTYAHASARLPLTPALGVAASAEYRATPGGTGGQVAGSLEYAARPLTFGVGLRSAFGDRPGLSATARAGYHAAPLDLEVTHAHPLGAQPLGGGAAPLSTLSARWQLPGGAALTARDELTWGEGHRATLGLESRLGRTNYAASYELPTADGAGHRARFGVNTVLPLGERLNLNLGGAYLRGLGTGEGEFSASAALRYQAPTASASAAADLSVRGGVARTVLRGGAALSVNETLTLTADALSEFGPARGDRFTVGAALRDGAWQGLATLRYRSGSLADGAPTLLGQADLEYHAPRFAVRAGFAARERLNDPPSLTLQPSLGATAHLNGWLGVGANLRASLQPGTGTALFGLGLEGSLRARPGTWVTLGYNVLGFGGVTDVTTRRGPYLRLDLTLDEQPTPTPTDGAAR